MCEDRTILQGSERVGKKRKKKIKNKKTQKGAEEYENDKIQNGRKTNVFLYRLLIYNPKVHGIETSFDDNYIL